MTLLDCATAGCGDCRADVRAAHRIRPNTAPPIRLHAPPPHSERARRPFVTITEADRHRPFFRAFGTVWLKSSFIGRILPGDVGKRVYLVDGILQVENDAQRERRVG